MLTALAPASARRSDTCLDDATVVFARLRPRLLGIARRILRDRTEAEDIVQEAWLRWQTYDRTTVLNPTAFLVTTTAHLALNEAQSARARRETYVCQLSPEPVETGDDPAVEAERCDALEMATQLLVQHLTPAERTTYVLRHAFDYPYAQIAKILQLSEGNARQLVSRAGRRMDASLHHLADRQPTRDNAEVSQIGFAAGPTVADDGNEARCA